MLFFAHFYSLYRTRLQSVLHYTWSHILLYMHSPVSNNKIIRHKHVVDVNFNQRNEFRNSEFGIQNSAYSWREFKYIIEQAYRKSSISVCCWHRTTFGDTHSKCSNESGTQRPRIKRKLRRRENKKVRMKLKCSAFTWKFIWLSKGPSPFIYQPEHNTLS